MPNEIIFDILMFQNVYSAVGTLTMDYGYKVETKLFKKGFGQIEIETSQKIYDVMFLYNASKTITKVNITEDAFDREDIVDFIKG